MRLLFSAVVSLSYFSSSSLLLQRTDAFAPLAATSSTTRQCRSPHSFVLLAAQDGTSSSSGTSSSTTTGSFVNGESSSSSGGLVTAASSTKSQLFSAFAALDLTDQYDAVLTGLCAKILDGTATSTSSADLLTDPLQLLQEMNLKKIKASPRSLMALIDAAVKTQDAHQMRMAMSACLQNGALSQFGNQQADIVEMPASPAQQARLLDGTRKSRAERLQAVNDIPVDDRAVEVANALAASAVFAACGITDVFGMTDISPFANLLLGVMVVTVVLDNFYDLVKTGVGMAANQVKSDSNVQLPDKKDLMFGLGSGELTGSVVRGWTRLFTTDAERESSCEAAALYSAYVLGLPCFPFRSNAYEASVMVVESLQQENKQQQQSLMTSSGIMRMLVWLLAPVAMEASKHAVCIMSDPREASGFLDRLQDYSRKNPEILPESELFWLNSEEEKADLLKWAYTEADVLLRSNKKQVTEIAERLAGGAATIGDCVAVVERWY